METQRYSLIARTHLLRMMALTQATVDHAVKAYERNGTDFCQMAIQAASDLHAIELSIADRGRSLLAVGKLMDATSRSAQCRLRVYSALRITHAAATEMARNTLTKIVGGPSSASLATVDLANLVNALMRLNTVAVFNRQIHHARTVLLLARGRRQQDMRHTPIHENAQEPAIARCLEQLVEQACEIADALVMLEDWRPAAAWKGQRMDWVSLLAPLNANRPDF